MLAVLLLALAGGFFGRSALATQEGISEQYEVFTAALRAIETNYVVPVESERLVYSAIRGMLQTLDPHSSFMDPKSYAQMRERQEGRYYGLGITITVVDGDITVVSVFEGSPAYLKGLRRGDVIARISGTDTKGWTSDQAVSHLKGPKGTFVGIAIRRLGYDDLISLEVPRDEIYLKTVRAAFMLNDQTGYLYLGEFAENSNQEVGVALSNLRAQGMQRLLLDLRNNPGGPLNQAIKVANQFLPRGELIVYTRGRVSNSDQDYHATEHGGFTDLPIIILVNRNSASASEIVAGALQDQDRALIVGETTFGKALVQSVYRVSQGAGLAVTTARYYTPSGRLIQRPWDEDGTFDEYLTYNQREQEPDRVYRVEDLKYTSGGRKVYSGGGIEPDQRFDGPVNGFSPSSFSRLVWGRQLFNTFAQQFVRKGDTRIPPGKNHQELRSDFLVDEVMLGKFREHVISRKVVIDEDAWQGDLEFIRAMIRFQIDVDLFSSSHARRRLFEVDPQINYALGLFSEARQLADLASKANIKRQ